MLCAAQTTWAVGKEVNGKYGSGKAVLSLNTKCHDVCPSLIGVETGNAPSFFFHISYIVIGRSKQTRFVNAVYG